MPFLDVRVMSICPQCHFENPTTNKFCERCGTSLTHVACPHCGAEVAVGAWTCTSCGMSMGGVLLHGILQVTGDAESDFAWGACALTEPPPPPPAPEADDAAPDGDDPYQRYWPLEAVPAEDLQPHSLIYLKILDRDPDRPRLMDQLLEDMSGGVDFADEGTEAAIPELDLSQFPQIVQPYLNLADRLGQQLPEVYDAWKTEQQQVVLLEDRQHWPSLVDIWQDEDTSILEILHSMNTMLELWEALAPVHCCHSLLEIPNLCVDEDRVLCLQQLHGRVSGELPLLKDLGQVWAALLQQSRRDGVEALTQLCQDLVECELLTPQEVRDRLFRIVGELESARDFESTGINPVQDPENVFAESAPSSPSPLVRPEGLADLFVHEGQTTAVAAAAIATEGRSPVPDAVDNDVTIASTAADLDDDLDDTPTVVLPMQLANLDEAGRTDIGRQRDHNEDCFGIYTHVQKRETPMGKKVQAHNLYILCDGMGGHAGGEVASSIAVETLDRYFREHWEDRLPSASEIRDAVLVANQAIFDANQDGMRSGSARMGTTLVAAIVHNSEVAVVHVGDSRLYRLSRRRGLEQITVDHEVGQREIQRGIDADAAYSRPDAYQLTQALGPRDNNFVEPDVQFLELDEDTLLLLCSDGLTDNDLVENHWQTHLAPLLSSRANLDQGVSQLIELANQHNGHDNITALLVRAKVQPNMDFLR